LTFEWNLEKALPEMVADIRKAETLKAEINRTKGKCEHPTSNIQRSTFNSERRMLNGVGRACADRQPQHRRRE